MGYLSTANKGFRRDASNVVELIGEVMLVVFAADLPAAVLGIVARH